MVQFYSKLFSSYEFLNFNCKALILMARVGTDCNLKKLGQGFQIKLLCCRLTMYCFPFDRIVWYLSFRVPMWTHVWEYLSGLTQKIWNSPWLTHLIEALQRRNIVQPFCNISFKVLNITNSLLVHQTIWYSTKKSSKCLKICEPVITVGAIYQHCFIQLGNVFKEKNLIILRKVIFLFYTSLTMFQPYSSYWNPT